MSERVEIILGSMIMGAMAIALEFEAVYVYTGGLPWQ